MTSHSNVLVRATEAKDIDQIIELSGRIYGGDAWRREQLESHLKIFPQGQLVAVQSGTGRVVGMAASLIVNWDDYNLRDNWGDFTDKGMFTNHDPEGGRTLYGAEVMVDPDVRRAGIGGKLYEARREMARSLNLRRIRAASRLRGYHRHASVMSAHDYVIRVVRGELDDPTLSFQLHQDFEVIAVVSGYLARDPESLGYAAIIEWVNDEAAVPEDVIGRTPVYRTTRAAEGASPGSFAQDVD